MTKLVASCTMFIVLIGLLVQNGHCQKKYPTCQPTSKLPISGAAYFQTNNPKGNAIIVNAIQLDGSLKFSHAVFTKGKGAYGTYVEEPKVPAGQPFPDTLFSQNSVIVGDNYLFTVNAGSNTVTMFSIDPKNPLILTYKCDRPTDGDFPVSLAYSSKIKMLCVVNSGEKSGVLCFSVDIKKGLITALPKSRRHFNDILTTETPPLGPLGTPSDILFNEDSTQLLVSVKGNPHIEFMGFIASFLVKGKTLGQKPVLNQPEDSVAPFSMNRVRGGEGNTIVYTDADVGFGVINFKDGKMLNSASIRIEGQSATCWSVYSPRLNTTYLTDLNGKITEVSVTDFSTAGAEVVKEYKVDFPAIDAGIGNLAEKDFLYILSPSADNAKVQIFSLDGPGEAKKLKPLVLQSKDVMKKCGVTMNKAVQGMAIFIKSEIMAKCLVCTIG